MSKTIKLSFKFELKRVCRLTHHVCSTAWILGGCWKASAVGRDVVPDGDGLGEQGDGGVPAAEGKFDKYCRVATQVAKK